MTCDEPVRNPVRASGVRHAAGLALVGLSMAMTLLVAFATGVR